VNSIDFRVREIDISISVKITGVHDISSDVLDISASPFSVTVNNVEWTITV
jgi:hypothetical protein